jgi:hypothetical protein
MAATFLKALEREGRIARAYMITGDVLLAVACVLGVLLMIFGILGEEPVPVAGGAITIALSGFGYIVSAGIMRNSAERAVAGLTAAGARHASEPPFEVLLKSFWT